MQRYGISCTDQLPSSAKPREEALHCRPCFNMQSYFWLSRFLQKFFQCFDTVGWAAGRASGLQKTQWWGAGVVICLERDADLHTAQLMPLPLTVSCFSKIQIGFTFLVPTHPGSPGQRAAKRVCVCVCV